MTLPRTPASLAALAPYLDRAAELQASQPMAAHYVRVFAMQLALKLKQVPWLRPPPPRHRAQHQLPHQHPVLFRRARPRAQLHLALALALQKDASASAFLMALMEQLEKEKAAGLPLPPPKIITRSAPAPAPAPAPVPAPAPAPESAAAAAEEAAAAAAAPAEGGGGGGAGGGAGGGGADALRLKEEGKLVLTLGKATGLKRLSSACVTACVGGGLLAPISPHISPYLPGVERGHLPCTRPYLRLSPRISVYLAISPRRRADE